MSDFLEVRGAKTHNLQNISVQIPKNQLIVITGVSGSGKSSLAFDTIYSEGQRKYLESLSTYARMIISSINEDTKVDEIIGLSPTISISQKTVSSNPRSTVGTITEIYDYYRLLFTTIGNQKCPNHPDVILKKETIGDVMEYLGTLPAGMKFFITASVQREASDTIASIRKQVIDLGFVRYMVGTRIHTVSEEVGDTLESGDIRIVVDRLVIPEGAIEGTTADRFRASIELAFKTGSDICVVYFPENHTQRVFRGSATCPECGFGLRELTLSHFSFNSHQGACEKCHGLGTKVTFLEKHIINPRLSIAEGAILPWSQAGYYMSLLDSVCRVHSISMTAPYHTLTKKERAVILYGVEGDFDVDVSAFVDEHSHRNRKTKYEGVIPNLLRRYHDSDPSDIWNKKIAQYVTEIVCDACGGYRLRPESLSIYVGGVHTGELSSLSVRESREFFDRLVLTTTEAHIAKNIIKNIIERLEFLDGVGLDYMTLSRRSNTISGGEAQRIRLATQIGSRLEGIIYILDEPSIGLHPTDNDKLITNIKRLVALGNTVIVVEHDEDMMRESDWIIDIGPGAGVHGGRVVFEGTYAQAVGHPTSETGRYLAHEVVISIPRHNRTIRDMIRIRGASENNLRNIDVDIPIGLLTVVTGVSGSGKSSLIIDTLANHVYNHFHSSTLTVGEVDSIDGLEHLDKAIIIDQSPIGKTPHSNVATYTGVFTHIREVFASSLDAQKRGYLVGHFSFNTKGGRCETCEGSGVKKIEMHFLPDVYVTCPVCNGSRYNRETLEVRYKSKTVADVLAMTIDEALDFFAAFPRIHRVLEVLSRVGLGYITLGQSAPTFSGGEAQRIKLAFDLAKSGTTKTLYILDEPTTGLHFSDIQKLLDILDSLVERGNTVLVIEHNLDLITNADWIIDIGPGGGDRGGQLVYSGPTDGVLKVSESLTGQALVAYRKMREK